jgi:hypothetical protein
MLASTGTAIAAASIVGPVFGSNDLQAKVTSTKVISKQPDLYCGWPTVCRRKNGQLWLVWSGGREAHVCPFGRVEAMTSHDNGESWTFPRVLLDADIDDRDAGVLETARGTLLVTTFSSLAYEPTLKAAEQKGEASGWSQEKLDRWISARDRLTAEERKAQLGVWMLRSTDGGKTFSAPYRCLVNSPHGPVQLSDGRVLYAGKQLWTSENKNGVCESLDDGRTWRWLATIPTREGDDHRNYHELHAVETADKRLIVHIRNHNPKNSRETLQTESEDGGKTWTPPHSIGVWGLPSHLLRLKDGRLLMSYGHRRKPFGNQARISEDHGRTWSEPMTISGDGIGGDLGYPSTVELDDGSLLTVWYEKMKQSPMSVLRQAKWSIS